MRNNIAIKSILSTSLFAAVASLMLSGCTGGGGSGGAAPTRPTADSYFPLTGGSWWRYEEAQAAAGPLQKSYFECRALKRSEYPKDMPPGISASQVYVVQIDSLPDPAAGAWDAAPTKMATGPAKYAYYVINDGMATLVQEGDTKLDPPRPIVPLAARPGQTWQYGGMTQNVMSARLTQEKGTQQVRVKADNDASQLVWTFQKGTGLLRKDWQKDGGPGQRPSLGLRVLKDSYIAPDDPNDTAGDTAAK